MKLTLILNRIPNESFGSNVVVQELVDYLRAKGVAVEMICLRSLSQWPPWSRLDGVLRRLDVQAPGCVRVGNYLVRYSAPHKTMASLCRRLVGKALRLFRLREVVRRALESRPTGPASGGCLSMPTPREIAYCARRVAKARSTMVMVDYAWLAPILPALPQGTMKAILAHDLIHRRVESLKASGTDIDVPDWDHDTEMAHFKLADSVIIETPDEAKPIQNALKNVRVLLMPRALRRVERTEAPVPGRCLFVGGGAGHNIVGLQWFIDRVWPAIQEKFPAAHLDVCGGVCASVHGGRNIRLHGVVSDLSPFYHAAQVCLVPLLGGSGFKTKLIEALSYGCPCVSTTVGAHGASDAAGRAVFVADEPLPFAEAVVRLLADQQLWRQAAQCAHEFVESHLSPDTIYGPILDMVRS